jgi:ferritin
MVEHYNRVMKLIGNYAAAYKTMTDDTASQLLREFLALQTAHVALLNGYLPKVQNALPPKKVARFYQVENKLRALVDYELARDIPLIK